ncbi:MAG: GNAT family N-acetyltransferase [Bdellovibrio sp.]
MTIKSQIVKILGKAQLFLFSIARLVVFGFFGLEVKSYQLAEIDRDEYINFFRKASESTPFHSLDWIEVIARGFVNYDVRILVIRRGKTILAAMPQFFPEKRWYFESGLRGCYGGWIYSDCPPVVMKLLSLALSFTVYSYGSDKGLYLCSKQSTFETWVLQLDSYERIIQSIDPKTRNQIRKSEKDGVVVQQLGPEHMNRVLELYDILIKKHGILKPYPKEFWKVVLGIKSDVKLIGAFLGENLISASLFIYGKSEVFYYMNFSDPAFGVSNGNNAIIAWVLKDGSEKKIGSFNFGAVPPGNAGLEHFKKNWNASRHLYMGIRKWDFFRRD